MGYNEGALIDETQPELPFKEGYVDWIKVWKQHHTPATWIKKVVFGIHNLLLKKIEEKKFCEYVKKFN